MSDSKPKLKKVTDQFGDISYDVTLDGLPIGRIVRQSYYPTEPRGHRPRDRNRRPIVRFNAVTPEGKEVSSGYVRADALSDLVREAKR